MVRSIVFLGLLGSFLLSGCLRGERVPESAYDPELIETAKAIREQQEAERKAYEQAKTVEKKNQKSECNRNTRGCKDGYICWDSWYCKQGFSDQCTESGDKKCHQKCSSRKDCPEEMPVCREIPVFNGSEHGVLEKFCVESLQ